MAITLGVIVGNRDFFPDALITEARRDLIQLFDRTIRGAGLADRIRLQTRRC